MIVEIPIPRDWQVFEDFPLHRSWVLGLCLVVGLSGASAAEVSWRPPDLYQEHVAPLLTPAEEVLATVSSPREHAAAGHDNTVVLHETLRRVEAGGAVLLVQHEIRRANTADGVEAIARASFAFRPGIDTMHLALARTLLPEGTWIDVDAAVVSIQALQPLSDGASVPEVHELVVVFPQVRVGGAVEYIIVLEQPKPRIPGQFTALLTFDFPSPVGRSRQVVDLPGELASKLSITSLGKVPQAFAVGVGDRQRISWQKDGGPALADELQRAPPRQEGPAVWLSTLGTWEVFARWYRTLLVGRDLLPRELMAQVDAWTATATSEEEIINILHRKVADEVGATGSEFAAVSLAPAAAAQVWLNRRGSGQDQANLLRAFLRHKGIVSHLALLDSAHAGRLETRSPDYRHFDHTILAIERGAGRYLWCDPTVPHLSPGELAPGVADRPVLVVRARGYQFANTPRRSSGYLDLDFDLALAPTGTSTLTGDVLIVADGVRGGMFRGWFDDLPAADLKDRLGRYLRSFFGDSLLGAVAVDKVELAESSGSRFELRAHFSASANLWEARGGELSLAHGGQVFRRLPLGEARQTSYFQALESSRIRLRYRLPSGWQVAELPPSLAIAQPALVVSSAWELAGNTLTATLDYHQSRSRIPAAAYADFAGALQVLDEWLERSIWVGPADAALRLAVRGGEGFPTAGREERPEPREPRPAPGSFGAAVATWARNHGPSWLEFAQPAGLEDPRVGEPREAISATNTAFNLAEKFKIGLLAAQASEVTGSPDEAFFSYALLVLDGLTVTWSAERQMLRAVMDDPGFSLKVRQEAYSKLLKNLFKAGLDDRLRQLLRHPLRRGLSPPQSKDAERLVARLEHARKTTPQIEALLLDLLTRPLDRDDQIFFAEYYRRLLNRGALDEAERVVRAMTGLRLTEGDTVDASRMRLELLQSLGETRDQMPVAEALRRVVFAHFDAASVAKPIFWDDLHYREAIDLMPAEVARRGRLWELSSGELDLRLLPWWMGSMLLLVEPGAERRELALQMTLAAARVAPDDETRLWFVLFGVDGIGDDDTGRRRRFHEALVAWSDPQKHPRVGEALRVLSASSELRQGRDPDLTEALVGLKQAIPRRIASRLKVRQAFLKRDTERLRFLLGELPEGHLLAPRTLDLHLPALRLAGMAREEAAAQQAGERALYEAILRTWVKPERWDILLVFKLSEVLYGSPAYPKAWLAHCLDAVGSRRLQHLIRLYDAELTGTWEVALGHAEALWAGDPESYDHAWAVGRAAFHLGLRPQAREALGVFVAHAHDHLRIPQAVEMLAKAEEMLAEAEEKLR